MTAIARILSRVSGIEVGVETLKIIAMFYGLDDRFHETGLDEASIYGTGIRLVDSSFEQN
jgi:hypothetical protein